MTRHPLELLHTSNSQITPFCKRHGVEVIMQTRSLDDNFDELPNEDDGSQYCGDGPASAVTSLHSSFDAALLERDDGVASIFRKNRVSTTPSWDSSLQESEVIGRKHSLQPVGAGTTELLHPGTVRKLPRRSSIPPRIDSTRTPGKPNRLPPPSTVKKTSLTPSSARRRRMMQNQTKSRSPYRRIPPTTPRYPRHAEQSSNKTLFGDGLDHTTPTPSLSMTVLKSRIQTGNTATTANTSFDATIGSDTHESVSPVSTPFRFTSFPASLPRVNPRSSDCQHSSPVSSNVRKRMSFTKAQRHTTAEVSDDTEQDDEPKRSKGESRPIHLPAAEEGAQNSSFSSVSGGDCQGAPQKTLSFPPPELSWRSPHLARCKIEAKNSEDSDFAAERGAPQKSRSSLYANRIFTTGHNEEYSYSDDDSPVRINVARTRLDFNMVMDGDEHQVGQQTHDANVSEAAVDLRATYPNRHVESFPSSVSSGTPLRNLSGYDELTTTSNAMTPSRSGTNNSILAAPELAASPDEVTFKSRLDAAQFSPIPPVDDLNPGASRMDVDSSTPNRDEGMKRGSARFGSTKASPRLSLSNSSVSSSSSSKLRRLRPMPDMSAFDAGMSVKSASSSRVDKSDESVPPSPKLLCPPTPVRTPAWAHHDGQHNPFARTNSLIVTKVLATCPVQAPDEHSPLETSIMDDESNEKSQRDGGLPSVSSTLTGQAPEKTLNLFPELPNLEAKGVGQSLITTSKIGTGFASLAKEVGIAPHTPFVTSKPPKIDDDGNTVISFAADFDNLGTLGSGAFADVYKVRSRADGQLYAVKRNRRQFRGKRDRDIALTEVRTMQKLQGSATSNALFEQDKTRPSFSNYILFFHRAWQEEGYFFCQTELCCRDTCREMLDSSRWNWNTSSAIYPSLRQHMSQGDENSIQDDIVGRLVPEKTVWKIAHDVVAGLSHIHSHNIVHNDIKPSNIFLVSHGRLGAMCKIGDFGVACESGTSEDGQEGDTIYMPPELLSSGVKHPSVDIFSLGLTLYELAADVSWEMPSEGPRWHELRSASHSPELPSSRTNALSALIRSMINAVAGKRPSADQLLSGTRELAEAGTFCDEFLRDYIRDVEEVDRREERRKEFLRMEAGEIGLTPRNAEVSGREIRTPTPNVAVPPPPVFFTPAATNKKGHEQK